MKSPRVALRAALVIAAVVTTAAIELGTASTVLAQGLSATITIEGRVKDADGNPIKGATVTAVPKSEGRTKKQVRTRKDGSYTIPFVENGVFEIRAEMDDLLMASAKFTIRSRSNQVESESGGDLGPDQAIEELVLQPGRTVTADFVMVPAARMAKKGPATGEVADWLGDASNLTAEGKFDESDAMIREEMEKNGETAAGLYLMGVNATQSGRTAQAKELLTRALELDPTQVGVRAQLGTIAHKEGDKEAALDWFRQEFDLTPNETTLAINIAVILEELGRKEEAAAEYERIIEMNPAETGAYVNLAGLYTDMGKEDEAIEVLKRMEDFSTPDPAFWFNIGAGFSNKDQQEKAEMAYRKALEIDPSFPEANRELGYILVRKGDMKGAVEHLELYLAQRPDAGDAPDIESIIDSLKEDG